MKTLRVPDGPGWTPPPLKRQAKKRPLYSLELTNGEVLEFDKVWTVLDDRTHHAMTPDGTDTWQIQDTPTGRVDEVYVSLRGDVRCPIDLHEDFTLVDGGTFRIHIPSARLVS